MEKERPLYLHERMESTEEEEEGGGTPKGKEPPSPRTGLSKSTCAGCHLGITGNCIYDEDNHTWHSECYQLKRRFEEEEEEEEEEESDNAVAPASHVDDFEKIVLYWRNLYFKKCRESDYHKEERDRSDAKISELVSKNHQLTKQKSAAQVPDVDQHPKMVALKEENEKLHLQLMEYAKELKASKSSSQATDKGARHTEKEWTEIQAKTDELLKNAMLERLEKDQEIIDLESQNESLRSQLAQLKAQASQENEGSQEREVEFKRMQVKLEKIMQLYEDLKQGSQTEITDLRKKNEEMTVLIKNSTPQTRESRSFSTDGLALHELQTKYTDLKGKYDAQLASLKGTSLEKAQSKRAAPSVEQKTKKILEAEAAVIKEGPLQYRLFVGVDGKKQKTKEWTESWALLNNQFIEFYPDKEARFTKKKVKLDLTGATVEYDKETKKKKEGGTVLRLTTEIQGSYQLNVLTLEDSEEWLRLIQQVCEVNTQANIDELAAGIARRSHCIPHRFKEAYYTLSSAKCKVCASGIHGRGFRCIHCNFTCHEKCSTRVPPNCGLADNPTSKTSMPRDKKATMTLSRLPTTTEVGTGNDTFEVELSHVPGGDEEIPLVVALCVSAIERKGGIECEGIYRIPGIKGEIEKLRMHFSYGRPNLDDEEWSDINAIGGALKLWFRLLPGSLLTRELFYEFIGSVEASKSEAQKLAAIKATLAKLPRRNYYILKYIIGHLHRVAEKGSVNKMFAENLGAVFGPSLMRSPKEDDMFALGPQCVVVEFMIKHLQQCFDH